MGAKLGKPHRTKTKIEILNKLAEFFALRTKDLGLIIRNREPNPTDIRSLNHSLKLLHDDSPRLITRLPYFDLEIGDVCYVYGLSDAGVAQYGGKTLDEHSVRTLDHELLISQFHVALTPLKLPFGIRWAQHDLKCGVNPDAQFTLLHGKQDSNFFLETERAKVGNYKNGKPSILRKFENYYDYYDTARCEKEWGFRKFRVLTIFPSDTRRDAALRFLEGNLRHRMFWMGTEKNLTKDFHTPKSDIFSFADL